MDPDLLALPAPPRGRRFATLTLMALVVVAAGALAFSVRHDVAFFFASSETIDLGEATALEPSSWPTNVHARVRGTPAMSRAARVRRVVAGGSYLVFPLAGQQHLYVQVSEGGEGIARTEFSGRLVTFSQLGGRMVPVRRHLQESMDLAVEGQTYLLIADEEPGSYAWALLLVLLCVSFVLVDLMLILRWFRPTPSSADEGAEAQPAE